MPVFNQSIKQLKDYELKSIDSLSNKSIAESEAQEVRCLQWDFSYDRI